MRRFLIFALSLVAVFGAHALRASACDANKGATAVESAGLSIDHYITDTTLHRSWAVMVDCSHPERPWILMPTLHQVEDSAPRRQHPPVKQIRVNLVVRAGGKVRLWRNADGASIELLGRALESGAIGQAIHVRTGNHGVVLEGRVRGAGSVELLISGRWQNKNAGAWSTQCR